MKFSVFQLSRRGGRAKNEDRMGYCHNQVSGLFVLADGMGGHPEGEVAAQMALQSLSAQYQKQAQPTIERPAVFLPAAAMVAHEQLVRYATDKAMLDVPRTTLVALLLQDGLATWLHCGDSRLYVVRQGALLLRTRDHSFVEHQTPSSARLDPVGRNILFSCLGSPTEPVFDLSEPLVLHGGDRLLLCSDGLWGNVADADIVRELSAPGLLGDAVARLVDMALRHGGRRCDNVTAVGVEWTLVEEPGTGPASSHSGSDHGFASTIASNAPEALVDSFDEEAIERSIAEINEAIRRSAAKKT